MAKTSDISNAADKVTSKAATLIETAAGLAEEAFEKVVDKADMMSATTANNLVNGARSTKQIAQKHSKGIGTGMIIGAGAMLLGGLVWLGTRGKSSTDE